MSDHDILMRYRGGEGGGGHVHKATVIRNCPAVLYWLDAFGLSKHVPFCLLLQVCYPWLPACSTSSRVTRCGSVPGHVGVVPGCNTGSIPPRGKEMH
jgi:hypothetical protein